MADPFAPSAKDRLRGLIGTAILLAFVGLGLWFAVSLLTSEEQQIVHEKMTVIGFGMGASYAGNSAIVRVRDDKGVEYQIPADANIGERCAIADSIDIQRQGINLQLGIGGCTRPDGNT